MSMRLDIKNTIKQRVKDGILTDGVGFELFLEISGDLGWDDGHQDAFDYWEL